MNRQEVIERWKRMKQEEDEIKCKAFEAEKELIKTTRLKHIAELQNKFLSEINFTRVKSIKIIETYSLLVLRSNPEDNIYDNFVKYEMKYKDDTLTGMKEAYEFVFEILYTKPHSIEFVGKTKFIHFT